jgi:hypothetical protein
MLKLTSRRAALVLTGATLALAAGVLPAQAVSTASTGWHTYTYITVKGRQVALLTGIDALGGGNAWAAGDAATSKGTRPVGLLRHWNGKAWKGVTLPSSIQKDWNKYSATNYATIGASASTNVWAFADLPVTENGDGYIRLNGHKWSAGILPGSRISSGHIVFVTGTRVFSRSDVWVFGGQAGTTSTTLTPYAAHFNGTKWKTYKVPGSGAITAASEISATNFWAVLGVPWFLVGEATAASPAVVQWNGSAWAAAAVQPSGLPAGANLTSILASRGSKVWIGGGATNSAGGTNEFTAKLTGSSWTAESLGAPVAKADFFLTDLVPDGSGGIWGLAESTAGAKPRFWHLTSAAGTTWTSAHASFSGGNRQVLFQLAEVPHSTSVWGVGAIRQSSSSATLGLLALYGKTPR